MRALDVANYFLIKTAETGGYLTNLKLQKLMYYAQAWYLAIHGKPLFSGEFEAWVHGPVLPSIYQEFKKYRFNPIIITKDLQEPKLTHKIKSFLDEILVKYGTLHAYQLELLTHSERPWLEARDDLPSDENSDAIISKKSMKSFYSNMLNG